MLKYIMQNLSFCDTGASRLPPLHSMFQGSDIRHPHTQRYWSIGAMLCLSTHHHVHHLLQQLHLLPIETRVHYKLCSLMYRVTHGLAPTYLTDLCQQCSNTRLRSASRGDYILPRSRLRCVGSSFSISAPTAWNNLPAHIRNCTSLSQFLSKLKSHLFITSFPPQ